MRGLASIAVFCCLTIVIGTTACTDPNLKLQKPEPAYTNLAKGGSYQSCNEPLPILGSGIVEYIQFQNIDQLIKFADLIVVGHPLTELGPTTTLQSMKARKEYEFFKMPLNQSLVITDPSGGTTDNWTLTFFKVEQTLKGKLSTSSLQILESGIVISGKSTPKHIRVIDSKEYTPLIKDKSYLLFLHKTSPTPTSFFDPAITYVTPLHQGKYNLDGGDCPEAILTKNNAQHSNLLRQVKRKFSRLFSQ
jgi:hypothetical protein